MTNDTISESNFTVNFSALKLRAGTFVKLQSLKKGVPDCEGEFVAAVHGKSILVAQPASAMGQKGLQAGDRYLVRGFNGTSEFTFTSEILQVQDVLFSYAHLAYPDAVEVRVVRDALRVKVSIPVVTMPDGALKPISGTLKNLSIEGAMVESMAPMGSESTAISIAFSTIFEERKVDLKIPAVIRNVHKHDAGGVFRSGLEFGDIAYHDKLVLYYLLFSHSENA